MSKTFLRQDKAKIIDMLFTTVQELYKDKLDAAKQRDVAHLFNILRQGPKPIDAMATIQGDPLTGELVVTVHMRPVNEAAPPRH